MRGDRFVLGFVDGSDYVSGAYDYNPDAIKTIVGSKLRQEIRTIDIGIDTIVVYKLMLVEKWKNGKRLT